LETSFELDTVGQRTKEGIVSWIKQKTRPIVSNLTTTKDAETLLDSGSTTFVGLFDLLEGTENEEFEATSRQEDDVLFYQTTCDSVVVVLGINTKAKWQVLVLLKKELEKISHFDGKFEKAPISKFIFANKLPLVTSFTRESDKMIFDSSIKKEILLFTSAKDYEKVIPSFQEAAKLFKGKILCVHVESDNANVGKPIMEYFSLSGQEPKVIGCMLSEEPIKYLFEVEIIVDGIKAFGEDFLADKLKPFSKLDPLLEKNDGDVKIVVGKNFYEIVLDESNDVLLEIYSP